MGKWEFGCLFLRLDSGLKFFKKNGCIFDASKRVVGCTSFLFWKQDKKGVFFYVWNRRVYGL